MWDDEDASLYINALSLDKPNYFHAFALNRYLAEMKRILTGHEIKLDAHGDVVFSVNFHKVTLQLVVKKPCIVFTDAYKNRIYIFDANTISSTHTVHFKTWGFISQHIYPLMETLLKCKEDLVYTMQRARSHHYFLMLLLVDGNKKSVFTADIQRSLF